MLRPACGVVAHADDEGVTFLVESDCLASRRLDLNAFDAALGGKRGKSEQKGGKRQ